MILTLIFASLIPSSFASGPCGGAQVGFWTNPDASRGGSVATTAKVQTGAFIASGAQVCESAQVKSGAKILDQAVVSGRAVINAGAEVGGRAKVQGEAKVGGSNVATKIGGDALVEGSAMVTGNTQVIARAKVRGSSKVHNAIVCQASVIEGFNVVDSDYYCQTEDPEPQHPGELGMKTLLGIDSDRDGVRDDLEIWINEKFSNTPSEDKRLTRLEFKDYSRNTLEIMKKSKIKSEVIRLETENSRIAECLRNTGLKGKLLEVYTEYEGNLMNTHERYKTWWEVQKYFAGMGVLTKTRGKAACRKK